MSNSQFGRVMVTEDGVYQPPPLKLEAALFVVALCIVLILFALGRAPSSSAGLNLAILVGVAIARFVAYRRYGLLGKPTVAIRDGTLVLSLPQDSRGQVVVPLAEFHHLIVYGRTVRRIFRFVRRDGTYLEVIPAWRLKVEHVAVNFLQHRLPPALQVTVEEPQTLFASIRGDGP